MPTLVTLVPQKWQGRLIRKGAQIQATDAEARILLALGRAKALEAAPVEAEKPKRTYQRKDVPAAPEVKAEKASVWKWPKADEE